MTQGIETRLDGETLVVRIPIPDGFARVDQRRRELAMQIGLGRPVRKGRKPAARRGDTAKTRRD